MKLIIAALVILNALTLVTLMRTERALQALMLTPGVETLACDPAPHVVVPAPLSDAEQEAKDIAEYELYDPWDEGDELPTTPLHKF